jgi:hypothetical protein
LCACGGSGGSGGGGGTPPAADFSISVSPASVFLATNGPSQSVEVSVAAINGFDSSVSVSTSGLGTGATASPSTFTLTPGQQQSVAFAATASASSAAVIFTGTSGTLSHTANLSLAFQTAPPAISSPSRATFIRDDSLTIDEYVDNQAYPPHFGVYDPAHKNFYVANPTLNCVEVYSAATEQLITSISVPAAAAVDITAAGDLVYVGTSTDYLFAIDTTKLEVVHKYASEKILPGSSFTPFWPVTLSDGRILILTSFGIDGSAFNVIWNPSTGSGSQFVIPASVYSIYAAVRSPDHSKVMIGGSNNAIYDVATSTLSVPTTSNVFSNYSFASNQDGSRWYVDLSGVLGEVDDQFNIIAQSTQSLLSGAEILVSRDGQTVYSDGGEVLEFDANSLAYKGWAQNLYANGVPMVMQDVDETGLIFGVQDHGVVFVDGAGSLHTGNAQLDETGYNLGYLTPTGGPIGVATPVQANVLAGVNSDLGEPTVYFGASQATAVNLDATHLTLSATSPVATYPGPVNLFSFTPSGAISLLPLGFSYGPSIVYPATNASVAQGGGPAEIFTFGAGTNAGAIQIGVGASVAPSSVQPGNGYIPYPFLNLQTLPFTVPAGSPGTTAMSVSAPTGSTSLSDGFTYYSALKQFNLSSPKLQQGVYDSTRQEIFFSNVDHIEVFSPQQGAWGSPIALPVTSGTRSLVGISISPDGKSLAVADSGTGTIVTLNPDQPSGAKSYSVQFSDNDGSYTPTSVAATNSGVYFVVGPNFDFLTYSSGVVSTIKPSLPTEPHNRVVETPDGATVAANFEGYMILVDTTAGTTSNPFYSNEADFADLAVSAGGTPIVEADAFLDQTPVVAGTVSYNDAQTQDVSVVFGQKLLSDGSLLLQPLTNQIDVIDTSTGLLRHRISLPVTISNVFDATVLDENDNALFVITSTGIAEIPLDQLPLAAGIAAPLEIGTGGGMITILGNGFTTGTDVTVDGKPVPATVVDQHTLRILAPADVPHTAKLVISNRAGQSITVQNAFVYSESPASASKIAAAGANGSATRRPSNAIPGCHPPLAGTTRQAGCGNRRTIAEK